MKAFKMEYIRFQTEEEFLRTVLKNMPYEVYPKVTAIGGQKINPDIDILQIKRTSGNRYEIIGYELKLIKFDKRSKGLSWNALYTGIGQALLYLKNGVHRAFLLIGFHKNIPDDALIDEFKDWLWENRELIAKIIGPYLSIGTYLYERSGISSIVGGSSKFYAPDEKTQLLSKEIFQGKFTFNKKLRSEGK